MNFIIPFYIFFSLIKYIIIADIIFSWLQLTGLKIRPQFIASIIDPLYKNIRKYIPTTVGPLDITPIIVFILIGFILGFINIMFPGSQAEFNSYFY